MQQLMPCCVEFLRRWPKVLLLTIRLSDGSLRLGIIHQSSRECSLLVLDGAVGILHIRLSNAFRLNSRPCPDVDQQRQHKDRDIHGEKHILAILTLLFAFRTSNNIPEIVPRIVFLEEPCLFQSHLLERHPELDKFELLALNHERNNIPAAKEFEYPGC